MSYLNQTRTLKTSGYACDKLQDCQWALYCVADLADDKSNCTNESGVLLALVGPDTYFPLSANYKEQGCVSNSTCDTEVIAMTFGLKQEGLPAWAMWEALVDAARPPLAPRGTGRSGTRGSAAVGNDFAAPSTQAPQLLVPEDSQSTIIVTYQGCIKRLRHLPRTHRISLAWLSEVRIACCCM